MTATKSDELRARVEALIKLAVDDQAKVEGVDPPDILRKAVREYLIKQKSPFIRANGRSNQSLEPELKRVEGL